MESIFISYKPEKEHDYLIEKITDKFKIDQFKIWNEKDVDNSNYIFCFITNQYINSKAHRLELISANEKNKNCVYIILEKLENSILNGIGVYFFSEAIKLEVYKSKTESQDEYGDFIYAKLTSIINKTHYNTVNQIYFKRDQYFTGRDEILLQMDRLLVEKKKHLPLW